MTPTHREKVVLGPWPGGMNSVDIDDRISDNEVCLAQNVIFDDNGVVYYRPPVWNAGFSGLSTPTTSRVCMQLLGVIKMPSGASRFLIHEGQTQSTSKVKYFDYTPGFLEADTLTWLPDSMTGTPTKALSTVVEYNNQLWFIPRTSTGGYVTNVDMTGTWATSTAANIPQGSRALMQKDRMFVMGDSRISWSKELDPTIWTAPDGGYVLIEGATSSSPLLEMFMVADTIWIFHKSGIFTLNWSEDPGVDGVLQRVSSNPVVSACTQDNRIFMFDGRDVFEVVGRNLINLSNKVNLLTDPTVADRFSVTPFNSLEFFNFAKLHILGGYLILTHSTYTGVPAFSYVMNMRTGAWSYWNPNVKTTNASDNWPGSGGDRVATAMIKDHTGRFGIFVAGWKTDFHIVGIDFTFTFDIYNFNDAVTGQFNNGLGPTDVRFTSTSTATWNPAVIKLVTKRYGFGDSGHTKRLYFMRAINSLQNFTFAAYAPTWAVTVESWESPYVTDKVTRTSQPIETIPSLVPIPLNLRFRNVVLSYDGNSAATVAHGGYRSQGMIEAIELYIRRDYQERLR